jgi:hypothetical protein
MSYNPRIGKQITYFDEPDTIVLELDGTVTLEEGAEINRRHAEFGEGRENVFFLLSLRKLESIHPTVRKGAAELLAKLNMRGMVGYDCPTKTRVIAKLIFTAMSLFSRKARPPLEFFATEEEARGWIRRRRAELAASPEMARAS